MDIFKFEQIILGKDIIYISIIEFLFPKFYLAGVHSTDSFTRLLLKCLVFLGPTQIKAVEQDKEGDICMELERLMGPSPETDSTTSKRPLNHPR